MTAQGLQLAAATAPQSQTPPRILWPDPTLGAPALDPPSNVTGMDGLRASFDAQSMLLNGPRRDGERLELGDPSGLWPGQGQGGHASAPHPEAAESESLSALVGMVYAGRGAHAMA